MVIIIHEICESFPLKISRYTVEPYTKSCACNMHISGDDMHSPWRMLYAGSICIYMHVARMFHVTCMDLGRFPCILHACNMRKTTKD